MAAVHPGGVHPGADRVGAAVSTVVVHMSGAGVGRVYVDGKELQGVVSVRFSTRAGHANKVLVVLSGNVGLYATGTVVHQREDSPNAGA